MYEVKNDFIQNRLRSVADQIRSWIPSGWGFTLFLFSYGENGELFYISTAEREDMVRTVEEWLARQKKGNNDRRTDPKHV